MWRIRVFIHDIDKCNYIIHTNRHGSTHTHNIAVILMLNKMSLIFSHSVWAMIDGWIDRLMDRWMNQTTIDEKTKLNNNSKKTETNNGEESAKQVKTKLGSVTKFQSKIEAGAGECEHADQRKIVLIIVANQRYKSTLISFTSKKGHRHMVTSITLLFICTPFKTLNKKTYELWIEKTLNGKLATACVWFYLSLRRRLKFQAATEIRRDGRWVCAHEKDKLYCVH